MVSPQTPFHPIIYVRGFAMSRGEIDETTADPFCGFNLGSTVYRAVPERSRPPRKFVFESPVIRLGSDFGYQDVYEDGYDLLDPEWAQDEENQLTSRSIVVYRYYDEASTLLGRGETPRIETFAEKLGTLILKVRELVCNNLDNKITLEDFRCHLVAHSMGGLVCRAFLQNEQLDPSNAARFVDKLFTYATPHNGIDLAGFNVPSWLGDAVNVKNFNRERMAEFLALQPAFAKTGRVDWLPAQRFPVERAFTMVGTNRLDYEAAMGLARSFVGHGSDGLVRIENATLRAWNADGTAGETCGKAFCYRAHSGTFGIVNSEEAYQNLTRFLFGDVRVDMHLDITSIRVPKELEAADADNRVNALYQIELMASPRGKLWYLTRRTAEEDSVACWAHADWKNPKTPRSHYLSTVFLANYARVNKKRKSLSYAVTLGVRVPDYEVERTLWFDKHYEGGYLFRDSLVVEMVPPAAANGAWNVKYAWQGQAVQAANKKIAATELTDGRIELVIPFDSEKAPGITGALRFVVSSWNPDRQATP